MLTLRPFLGRKGHSSEDLEKMHAACVKAAVLQAALWSHPYAREEDWTGRIL
ncbi:MAG: hypothetical protein QN172_07730 [Armatimonadota bacterium]|nr:hypothetical protein [Armatimonadota bacterium]MDR7602333.1 hypothetical protein [Armatimonadota bacterium]